MWWGHFELLKAAGLLRHLRPDDEIRRILEAAWLRAGQAYIDRRYGGITTLPMDSVGVAGHRFRTAAWRTAARKGDRWKDASHDGRTLLRLDLLSTGGIDRISRDSWPGPPVIPPREFPPVRP